MGGALALLIPATLKEAADAFLLPISGILVGLSFAWAASALSLMQDPDVERWGDKLKGGLVDYAYTFQLAILVLLAAIVAWGLAAVGVFDARWPTLAHAHLYFVCRLFLYALGSLGLQACWQAVLGVNYLVLVRADIRAAGRGLLLPPVPQDEEE